jgi:hypothetical protein
MDKLINDRQKAYVVSLVFIAIILSSISSSSKYALAIVLPKYGDLPSAHATPEPGFNQVPISFSPTNVVSRGKLVMLFLLFRSYHLGLYASYWYYILYPQSYKDIATNAAPSSGDLLMTFQNSFR